jgi:hypothetical protein
VTYLARVSRCLGGVRISNLHTSRRCPFLNRENSVGTPFELDERELAALPDPVRELIAKCKHCSRMALARKVAYADPA